MAKAPVVQNHAGKLTPAIPVYPVGADGEPSAGGGSGGAITGPLGRDAAADSISTVASTEDKAVLDAIAAGVAAATTSAPVAFDTSNMYIGVTPVAPLFASVSLAASGDMVPFVASKKIRVLAMFLVAAASTTAKIQSGGTADLTGALPLGANGGFVLPFNPAGWFETVAGAKLNLVMGSSVAMAGSVTYIPV